MRILGADHISVLRGQKFSYLLIGFINFLFDSLNFVTAILTSVGLLALYLQRLHGKLRSFLLNKLHCEADDTATDLDGLCLLL